MLRSLIMKAYYKKDNNCQVQLDSLVSKILEYIQTSEQWHYISNFFVDLCEVSPNSVLNKLEEEQINPTGLVLQQVGQRKTLQKVTKIMQIF